MTPYYTFHSLLSYCMGNWQIERVSNTYNTRMKLTQFVKNYNDVIICTMAFQITGVSIAGSTVYSGADQRNHQSSASLAFVRESNGDRWIPLTKASNAVNVSIWWHYHGSSYDWAINHKLLLGLTGTLWQLSSSRRSFNHCLIEFK